MPRTNLTITSDHIPSTTQVIPRLTGPHILRRGHTYCYDSFHCRVLDWEFASRAAAAAPTENPNPEQAPPPRTRVQPSRTAKKPVVEPPPVASKKRKRKVEESDYMLVEPEGEKSAWKGVKDVDVHGVVMRAVRGEVERQLLAAKAPAVKEGTHGEKAGRRCSVAELPLGCVDMLYCLHGLGKEDGDNDAKAKGKKRKVAGGKGVVVKWRVEEAEMLPSPSLGNWTFEGIEERVRECGEVLGVCGLSFKVDLCDGGIKIVMA